MSEKKSKATVWPVLKSYDKTQLSRIALPLGGIGTGTISLRGRGALVNWEVMNRPAKWYTPPLMEGWGPFFCIRAKTKAGTVQKIMEGPLEDYEYEGGCGSPVPCHGLARFREARFDSAYPLGQVHLSDKNFPLKVRLDAFNPLVPGDADASGIPVVVLRYVLSNPTSEAVSATVCGSVPNFIEAPVIQHNPYGANTLQMEKRNRNEYRDGAGVKGIMYHPAESKNEITPSWGTLALTTTARTGVSYRTAWLKRQWNESMLDFWDDLLADGALSLVSQTADLPDGKHETVEQHPDDKNPVGSLAVKVTVPAKGEAAVTFMISWNFPNRWPWGWDNKHADGSQVVVGNYYSTQYADAWAVAESMAKRLPELEKKTVEFVRSFCDSDLPDPIKEAALCNVSTLRTETCFRTKDGRFFGWEGIQDKEGSCHGNCTHVWNYEQTTAFMFGSLSRSMREIEFNWMTNEQGKMGFRCNLPLGTEQTKFAAADGQMGCIMKMYRDWQLSGDSGMLKSLWPKVRKSLEFAWIPNGWDGDRDGVMEGCQHNTMDVEYYGPNPQMQIWYLGALRAAEEMARFLDETAFADECRALYQKGSVWCDAHLFNGEYYEQEIRPVDPALVPEGLMCGGGRRRDSDPTYQQIGTACLVDQLVGQYMAHVCGLGYLVDAKKIRTTLKSIIKYNRRKTFFDHANHMRSYAICDETALLMASYPKGDRPRFPFPYFTEVMTGFEYTVGVHCLYEGLEKDGLEVYRDIRARYDGRRRSPFNEAECGHHYSRAMISWAGLLAWTGFHYSGLDGTLQLGPRDGKFFWSNGDAYGSYEKKGKRLTLQVVGGSLRVERIVIAGTGEKVVGKILNAGKTIVL